MTTNNSTSGVKFELFESGDLAYITNSVTEFEGDIVIIDPSFLFDEDDDGLLEDAEYGMCMEEVGFNNYMCGGFNLNNQLGNVLNCYSDPSEKENIGIFHSDSCHIGIFLLSEIKKFKPLFSIDKYIKNNWAVVIRNFNGKVSVYQQVGTSTLCLFGNGNKSFFIPIHSVSE